MPESFSIDEVLGKEPFSIDAVLGQEPKQQLPEGYTRIKVPPAELEALKNFVPPVLQADTRSESDQQASYLKWRDSQEFADQVRALEAKRRKDYGLEVDAALLDKERRTDTLEKTVTALPINIATGLQNIGEQVGGAIAAAATLQEKLPYLPPSLLSIPAVRKLVKEQGDTVREVWGKLSAENRRDIEGLGQDEAGKALGRLVETAATSTAAIPAAVIGGLPAAAGVAGAQSFGGTFNEAQAAYEKGGDDKATAGGRALAPAIASGVATALITAAGGKTGIEAIAKLGSAQAVKALGAKNLKDIAGSVLKNFGAEAVEEGSDQIVQSIIRVASYNPELSFKDAVGQVMEAGVMGGILGGAVGGAVSTVETIQNRKATKGEPNVPRVESAVEEVPGVKVEDVGLPKGEAGVQAVQEAARTREAEAPLTAATSREMAATMTPVQLQSELASVTQQIAALPKAKTIEELDAQAPLKLRGSFLREAIGIQESKPKADITTVEELPAPVTQRDTTSKKTFRELTDEQDAIDQAKVDERAKVGELGELSGYTPAIRLPTGKIVRATTPKEGHGELQALYPEYPTIDRGFVNNKTGKFLNTLEVARERMVTTTSAPPADMEQRADAWLSDPANDPRATSNIALDPVKEAQRLGYVMVSGYYKFQRGAKQFKDWSSNMLSQFGAWVQPYLQPAWDKITMKEFRLERDRLTAELFTPTEEQLAALKTGGNVIGQLASARRIFNELTADPNTERVVKEPTLRKVGKAIEGVDEMAANYPTLQADPAVPRQIKSKATNDAAHQIRTLEDSVARSEERFAGKEGMVDEKKKLAEKLDKVLDKKAMAGAFLDEFKRAGKQAYRDLRDATRAAVRENVAGTQRQTGIQQEIAGKQAAHAAFRAALGRSEAVAKVFDFLSRMDIDPTQFKNTSELLGAMKSKAANFPAEEFHIAVNADIDTINTVARVIMASEPLRQRVADLKDIEGASNQFAELQRQLRETLKAGDVGKVINQMLKGVGKTAADKALSAKAAKLLLAQEKRLADSIMVLEKSNEAIKAIINSPDYKAMKAQVYADAGIRDIIATTTGYEVALEPVVPGEPVVKIPVDTAVSSSREALEMAADYKAKALAWLDTHDPASPNYDASLPTDPKHVAGLRHFLTNQFDAMFNPGIMPDAGRMLPSMLSSLTRGLFSWVGNPELVPMWIKQYGAGLVFNRVAATENASSAGLQAVRGVFDEYQPRLQRASRSAMKAHGIRDAADYKEDVLVPILASRQDFATTPLKAGDDLKDGYTVKGTDMAYASEMLAFEQAVIKALTATTGQAYASISVDPVGILFKDAKGKPVYRLPLDTGPSTTGRSLSSAYQFAKDWASRSPERRILLLDGSERILRGYVKDATNPAFKWTYGYREALVEVWNEMSSTNRLKSFDDLVSRVADKVDDAPDVVAAKLTGELDALFNRLVKEQDAVKVRKELADSQGGVSQFNTERGNQVVPSEWYDYGMITTGDFFSFQMLATEPLAIAHLNAVNSAVQFLSGKVDKLDVARLAEEDVFTLAQAKDSLTKLDAYHGQLKRAMDPKVVSRNAADLEYPGLGRAIFDFGIASLLGKPVVGAANIIGGGWQLWRSHMAVRQQSFLYAGASASALMTQRIYQMGVASLQSSRNPVTKHIGNAVAAARNTPLVGALARHLARQNEVHRELYSQSVEDGIIRQRDAASSMGSLLDMVERARSITPRAPRSVGRKLAGKATATLRFGSRAITRYTIQTGDDLLNTIAHQESMDFRKDFENRAKKFGEVREQRAIARGVDPTDVTKAENRFTDREIVDGPLWSRRVDTKTAALDTRVFIRDRVGVDLDAKMWDYYQRRKAAKAKEISEGVSEGTYTADVRLFSEQEMRQLRLAIAERFNLASRSSRPIGTHTGVLQKNMGVLLGYTGFALEEFLQATARLNTRGSLRGYGWTLPVITGLLLSAALVGTLLLQPARQELRELWNNSASQVPTTYNAQTDAQQRDAWISGTAALIPLFGGALALLTDNASSKGYNLDSQFVALNMASDVMRTARAAWEMGDATVPIIRFAERNVFPATFLAQFMPQYSGLKETAKDRAELVLAAKGSGLEAMVRAPGRGEPRYTELSPLLNEFSNAIGNRDQAGAVAAFNAIVQKKTEEGAVDPQKEALRAVRSRNPLGVFAQQPTGQQLEKVLASMPPEKAARVRDTLSFFGSVVGQLGGTAQSSGGQSGGSSAGGGGFGRSSFGRTRRVSRGRGRRPRRGRSRVGRTRRMPSIRRRR